MNKKLQVFVSSTYTDLIEERQVAVEAILDAGHIPAGMELFKAGKSQMETIHRWIDESDVYMLILGGRYGSIEEESGLSYTELEYRYALSKNMPVFAIVLNDSFLFTKAASKGETVIFENKSKKKYSLFKKYVKTNVVKFVSSIDAISSAIHSHLNDIQVQFKDVLCGWVKYSDNKIDFDNRNSLSTLTMSYNNLMDKYTKLSKSYDNLSKCYDEQKSKSTDLTNEIETLYYYFFDQYTSDCIHTETLEQCFQNEPTPLPYDQNQYRSKEKLLEYVKLSMYALRFKEFKLNRNFYTLKPDVIYYLEDLFILLYHLAYCNTPVKIFKLGNDHNNKIFKECFSIFFHDNLFYPFDIDHFSPIMLTITPNGHELYKYLISTSVII